MYVPQAGSDKAEMHFIINGEDQGVCGKDIPYKAGPLRAVVDVYGTTKQVRIVQLYGGEYWWDISLKGQGGGLKHLLSRVAHLSLHFSSIDSAERLSRCYIAVHEEERGELAAAAEIAEGLPAVPIAMRANPFARVSSHRMETRYRPTFLSYVTQWYHFMVHDIRDHICSVIYTWIQDWRYDSRYPSRMFARICSFCTHVSFLRMDGWDCLRTWNSLRAFNCKCSPWKGDSR